MLHTYRQEPGRLVLELSDLDCSSDRIIVDQSAYLHVDLGRRRISVPPPLDWSPSEGTFVPVRVLFDPAGRVWSPLMWTDSGHRCELWTPMTTLPAP